MFVISCLHEIIVQQLTLRTNSNQFELILRLLP